MWAKMHRDGAALSSCTVTIARAVYLHLGSRNLRTILPSIPTASPGYVTDLQLGEVGNSAAEFRSRRNATTRLGFRLESFSLLRSGLPFRGKTLRDFRPTRRSRERTKSMFAFLDRKLNSTFPLYFVQTLFLAVCYGQYMFV